METKKVMKTKKKININRRDFYPELLTYTGREELTVLELIDIDVGGYYHLQ